MIRNTAGQKISAVLISRTDGSEVGTGTTTVYVTIDGGTQSTGAGSVEYEGHGNWTYSPTQAETNGTYISFVFSNAAAVTAIRDVYTTVPGTTFSAPGDPSQIALSAQQIINFALNEIGFLAPGEAPVDANSNYALVQLNSLLDSWGTQRRFIYCTEHNEYTIGASKQSYTLGPDAADFSASLRPDKIKYCNLIIGGADNVRVPVGVINADEYARIPVPALSSDIPVEIYYQPTWPNGTLWPHPYPTNTAYKFEFFTALKLTYFASLNQTASLPSGYRLALIHTLAEQLCPAFGRPLTVELERLAREARASIANVNIKSPAQESDYPGVSGGGMVWNSQVRGWVN